MTALFVAGQGALGASPASALGYSSRHCPSGGGTTGGLSASTYVYTEIVATSCNYASVWVKSNFQVYPGGPYMWTPASYGSNAGGHGFVRVNQSGTIKAQHGNNSFYWTGP